MSTSLCQARNPFACAGTSRYDSSMHASPPVALTIAGSDCSSGAGIQADLKTFQHFRVHGLTAITCIVSETANIVRAVSPVPVEIVADQISLMLRDFPVAAIKTGMLFSAAHIEAVMDILKNHPDIPLVVDPVMIASTGASLLEEDAVSAYHELVLPRATVITPNLPEAEALAGVKIPDLTEMETVAKKLAARFRTAVLLKGGHLDSDECLDFLTDAEGNESVFTADRLKLPGSHGTGCTFSAAIAARLALGDDLPAAVGNAKTYLTETLRTSYTIDAIHALNQGTLPF
ncbi:MAG: bifunctional hydroxymethylpyrimidine kinase/phosphomethylpyrimidine kinase [Luteolibacter sp.]